jgi:hydrogenase maturation protein HypF
VGFVRNLSCGVEIEIEGGCDHLEIFRRRLECEAPPPTSIKGIEIASRAVCWEGEFRTLPSERGHAAFTIPPDLAICAECAREIFDPGARRYGYPFTNCTFCGPRFTVIETLPYDRNTTTMRAFPLCTECEREYLDPSDRRFRAEPIACPQCGPKAWIEICSNEAARWLSATSDPIDAAAAILRGGGIVAVQGIGGVHLACNAAKEEVVLRLRAIKRRPRKPLAIMVDCLRSAAQLATISQSEAALLTSSQSPIVLVSRKHSARLAPSVAPGNDHVGLLIAYSPLHYLLIRNAGLPLVMTSANMPGEPLARMANEVRAAFGCTVDALLLHNRPIHQRCDDSVWAAGPYGSQPIRLSRGATPSALTVPVEARAPILGIGGDLKNSFCLLVGRQALMSQYIGTLETAGTQAHFEDSLRRWLAVTEIKPCLAVHDLHPRSVTRELASRLGIPTVAVQHHHAHIAACMAEHGRAGPVIGIAFDGTGYGKDGAIWGGEALVADFSSFERISHLQYMPIAGGDAAIRQPARIAAAYQLALFGEIVDRRLRQRLGLERARILGKMLSRGINTVHTSSCGRLFDAVAALLEVCDEATYEAQAAIELETIARKSHSANRIYPSTVEDGVVSVGEILAAVQEDIDQGVPAADIARAFHQTIAEVIVRMATDAKARTGIDVVALSGGCFQNRLLLAASIERLEREGFSALIHHRVPANDGGLALGQAAIAAAQLHPEVSEGLLCA